MRYLQLNELTIGDKVNAIRTPSFWGAFEEEGTPATLTLVGFEPLVQNGPVYFGNSRNVEGFVFEDEEGNTIVLCPINSMGCGDKSVYRNCFGEEGYQLIA